ncbi:uncharacterized protein LOC120359530 [Solenopsis invicta]|uniref:uncharacterized protein LOC120359530 n=1 Tax=Solenopsis invicta TaxID=13686 RepID=UPI00193E7F74|nr:uncharacterized protein LOC120359530 [Solenopsis invicta]
MIHSIGMEENMNEEQDLNYEKQPTVKNKEAAAIWTNEATLALLALYESKMGMLDHPKKKTKIWIAIADGLKDFQIEMSPQQVRWKMNALTKRYKECVDSNNKTGRGTTEFQWFDQLDEILGNNKNTAKPAYTVSSKLCSVSTSKNKKNSMTATKEPTENRGKKRSYLNLILK